MKMYFVYILECEDGSLYTGITTNLIRRFDEHLSGVGGNYTRAHKPVKIVYEEKADNRSIASKREAEIKNMSKKDKLNLFR